MAEEDEVGLDRQRGLPYSKGLTAQALMATGTPPETAWRLATALEKRLVAEGRDAATIGDLRQAAAALFGEHGGRALMERFDRWRAIRDMDRPLVILIGGTTGVGKSTLANQLAHLLGIVRVASTDMVRQVMRAFFAEELMPAIHYSSFDCARAVRVPLADKTDLSRIGFIEQVKSVRVGIEALVGRAVEEKLGLVLEGVHLVPGYLDRASWGDAIVVELVVAMHDAEEHRLHFTARDWHTGGVRPLRRYLDHFEEIRHIQDFILERAAEQDVSVIENRSIDDAVRLAMEEVFATCAEAPASGADDPMAK